MKKTYIKPVSTAIAFEPSHMLAGSTDTNSVDEWDAGDGTGIGIKTEGTDSDLSDDIIG